MLNTVYPDIAISHKHDSCIFRSIFAVPLLSVVLNSCQTPCSNSFKFNFVLNVYFLVWLTFWLTHELF